MRTTRSASTVVLATALALLLAACGGSDTGMSADNAAQTPAPAEPADPVDVDHGPPTLTDESLDVLEKYEAVAQDLVRALDAGEPAQDLAGQGELLADIAAGLLPDFLRLRPECTDYLQAAVALRARWQSLTVAQIESGYHQDGELPPIDGGDAHASGCYHMKDLIVHPITAQAMLVHTPEDRDAARNEIVEVITHIAVVRALQ